MLADDAVIGAMRCLRRHVIRRRYDVAVDDDATFVYFRSPPLITSLPQEVRCAESARWQLSMPLTELTPILIHVTLPYELLRAIG